jgi:hypothetical protein
MTRLEEAWHVSNRRSALLLLSLSFKELEGGACLNLKQSSILLLLVAAPLVACSPIG